jgi:hypothetical protein
MYTPFLIGDGHGHGYNLYVAIRLGTYVHVQATVPKLPLQGAKR